MAAPATTRLIVLASLGLSLSSSIGAQAPIADRLPLTPDPKMDPLGKECLGRITPALLESGGRFTAKVRKAYADWCWADLRHDLLMKNQPVDPDALAEVESDPVLKDAVSIAVYPPDPSILQNYAEIRAKLGPAFTKKYRNLSIAVALARRIKGVESDPNVEVGRENQRPVWAYVPLNRPANEAEKQFIAHIADFMHSKGCSALELYNSDGLRHELADFCSDNNVNQKYLSEIGKNPTFGERIKNAMVANGQRPAARTSQPDCITWLKHVASLYESNPSSVPPGMTWPLFSLTATPWPLLMPLSHSVPLDEANYLWETYQGLHGDDRYHTYGPYRDDLTEMPDELLPSRWFWNAVPDQIVHGGECMPISLATIDLYASLGKPSGSACQPGHANLVSFGNEIGTWKADIEQDFAGGARVTQSQWFFDDPARGDLNFQGVFGWPGAEYHLGLAVAMNLGLTSYLDTRIAGRIYDLIPMPDRAKYGRKLLDSSLEENPFNPEIWYRLATLSENIKSSVALIQSVIDHNPKQLVDGVRCAPLGVFVASGKSGPANDDMSKYWSVLQEVLTRKTILVQGAPQDEQSTYQAYKFMKAIPGLDPGELSRFTHRFVEVQSKDQEAKEVQFDQSLANSGEPFGCLRMGQRYLDGDGVARDEAKAHDYFLQAARQGEPSAASELESVNILMPTDGIEVIASSTYSSTQDVKHLLDGSGMTGGVHDNSVPAATMWQTADNPPATPPTNGLPPSPAWVRFNFPQARTFDAVEIWNHNQANLTDRGFKKFKIYGSPDGAHWSTLTRNAVLPRAGGTPYEPGVTVPTLSSGRLLKSVIIAADTTDGNYGSVDYGLSAVRFVSRPIFQAVPAYEIQVHVSDQYGNDQAGSHLIDGSGMIGEFHDNNGSAATMWTTKENPPATLPAPLLPRSPGWARFNFATPRFFDAIRVWNGNQANQTNRGFKWMQIYGTSDGINWFILTTTDFVQLPQSTGAALSAGTTFFNVSPERPIRSVVIEALPEKGNYGGNCYALSAVRFILPDSVPTIAANTERSTVQASK